MNDSALEQRVRGANPVPAARVAGAWADSEAEGQRARILSGARRGGGRARRRLGALVSATMFAALLALVGALLLARSRPPSPSAPAATPSPEQFVPLVARPRFSVFARPARSSDRPPALPAATRSFPVPTGGAWRLAARRSGISVYVAPATAGSAPEGVCVLVFRERRPDIMNCPPLRVVAAGKVVLPVRRRGLPGYLIGLLPDGVVGVSDGLGSAPVRANAYILRHRPWSLPSAVTYRLAKGTQRTVRLP